MTDPFSSAAILSAGKKFAEQLVGGWIQKSRDRRRIEQAYVRAAERAIDDCPPSTFQEVSLFLGNLANAETVSSIWRRRAFSELPDSLSRLSPAATSQIRHFIELLVDELRKVLPVEDQVTLDIVQSALVPLAEDVREIGDKVSNKKGPRLTTFANRRFRGDTLGETDLLSPYSGVSVEIRGRTSDFDALKEWLFSPRRVSIRVLTGRGGVGKTRLALELCKYAKDHDWEAGFLPRGAETALFGMTGSDAWKPSRSTLVVIDYVAARALPLFRWFAELADSEKDQDLPLRILLLERWADTVGGWWLAAFGSGGDGDSLAVQKLLDPPAPVAVFGLDLEDRRRILVDTMEAAGSRTRPPETGENPLFDRQLATVEWGGEPLYLIMAGLFAAQEGVGTVLSLRRTDLAFSAADREIARLTEISKSHKVLPRFQMHMAAYATVCEGLSVEEARKATSEESDYLGHRSVDLLLAYEALQEGLPGDTGGVSQVLPDVIGEAVVLRAFATSDYTATDQTILRAASLAGLRVAGAIIRIAQDYGHLDKTPVVWLKQLALHLQDADELEIFARQLPEETTVLSDLAADIELKVVELQRAAALDGTTDLARLARSMRILSVRLSDVGRRDEAAAAAQESVNLCRDLWTAHPETFRPDLAAALNNLANRLSDLGRREEALTPAQDAVDLYRELAAAHPDAFRPNLAASLSNLSNRFSDLGRRKEALTPAQEALGLHRELAAAHPDAFRHRLASSLDNLSIRLSRLGRSEEALIPAQEALDLHRELAAAHPDAFRPNLASSLNNLANHLSKLGRHEEALIAGQDGVDVFRELAAGHPDAFRPDLAASLNNQSIRLANLGRREEALILARDAVDIRRELAAAHPDAFRPGLAVALNNLALRLSNLGRNEEALTLTQEATDLYRELSAAHPDAFRPGLAVALNNLALRLSNLGRNEEALTLTQEAVDLYRQLAIALPGTFRPNLAAALNNLGVRLSDLGLLQEALIAGQEAVDIRRELAAAHPDAFRPNLASALNNLAICLSDLGRKEEALTPAEEAVDIHRELAAARPEAFRPNLASSVYNLSNRLSDLGRKEEALTLAQEAVDIRRQLAAEHPDAFRPGLAAALNNLANRLSELGRREEALIPAQEAVDLRGIGEGTGQTLRDE